MKKWSGSLLSGLALTMWLAPTGAGAQVSAKIEAARRVVEEVRGQRFTRRVESEEIGGSRLHSMLSAKLEEGLPVSAEKYFQTLAAIGALSPSDLPDLKERLVRFYQGQVLAFYDPESGKFYVSSDAAGKSGALAGAEENLVFTHEMTHALQDQHMSLQRRMESLKANSDAALALQSLLEGEATVVMIEAASRDLPGAGEMLDDALDPLLSASLLDVDPGAAGVPAYFTEQLLFPYAGGSAFIRARKKSGGWKAIDRLWDSPPTATSEILHPAAPENRAPDLPSPAATPPPGFSALYSDTLGEWTLRFLLSKSGAPEAEALASQWRADRFTFFESGGRIGYVGKIRAADSTSASRILEGWKALNPSCRGSVRENELTVWSGFEKPPV